MSYRGAFSTENWLAGWTFLDEAGILGDIPEETTSEEGKPQRTITDADIDGDMTWSSDTVYVLSGYVFVEDGESLTIPAGTVIKGMPGQGTTGGALRARTAVCGPNRHFPKICTDTNRESWSDSFDSAQCCR